MATGILETAAPAPPPAPKPEDDWYNSYITSAPDPMKTYEAEMASAATWTVAPDQTVQNQIEGIIKKDSPLMQMARTQSLQDQAARGLGNSSLAIGAGQRAVYGAATPIASQDASTYANAARTNAELATQVNLANAGFKNDAYKFNAGAFNTSSLQQRDLIAQHQRQQESIDADWKKQQSFQEYDAALKTLLQRNDLSAQERLQANALAAEWQKQQSFQAYDSALKMALQSADQAGRVQLQNLDSSTRLQLADIEQKYKVGMQTSASMASTYQSMIDSITQIMANTDLDAPAKQAAIDNMTVLYDAALKSQEAISGLDLGDLLVFDDAPAPAPSPAPAPAPAPAPIYQNPSDGR